LEYTIHFQNIGTDTARNVVISNPVDTDLDISSLNVIGASHEFDLEFVEEGRFLQWSFNNINLPDSTANELESNGFTLVEKTVSIIENPDFERCDYTLQLIENDLRFHFPVLDKYKIIIYDMNGHLLQ